MSCWSCKYESVRDGKPCQGCNHGRWWEPKDAPQPEQEVDPHAKLVDDLLAETAPKARQEQVAAPQGMYKAESIDGNQHNTGRVYTGAGSYFADAASFDKAKLIADALNAYSHPGPKAEPVKAGAIQEVLRQVIHGDFSTDVPENLALALNAKAELHTLTNPAPKAEPVNQMLLDELRNIANANPRNWDAPLNDTASFQAWAQSRARAAVTAAEQVQPAELTEQETVAWLITHGEDFFATNEEAYAMSFAEDERQELVLRTPQEAKT